MQHLHPSNSDTARESRGTLLVREGCVGGGSCYPGAVFSVATGLWYETVICLS